MLFRMISDLIDLLTDEEEFDPSWMDKEKFTKMEEEKKYPCLFPYRCRDGAVKIVKPIECDNNCLYCAWNPEEKKRRFEEGRFIHEQQLRFLSLLMRGIKKGARFCSPD